MCQKLPLVGFKWVEDKSQFHKDFIDIGEGCLLEINVQYP